MYMVRKGQLLITHALLGHYHAELHEAEEGITCFTAGCHVTVPRALPIASSDGRSDTTNTVPIHPRDVGQEGASGFSECDQQGSTLRRTSTIVRARVIECYRLLLYGLSVSPLLIARRHNTHHRKNLFSPHVDSFNHFCEVGTQLCVDALEAQEIEHPEGGERLRFWIEKVDVARPVRMESGSIDTKPLLPSECRERGLSYRGTVRAFIMRQVGDGPPERIERRLGLMPVMVRSSLCHLKGLNPAAMVARHEEGSEMGGYFVINGNERAVRLLIAPRRNHLMGIIRPSFRNRGPDFLPHAVLVRCLRADGTSQTVGLHLLTTGGAKLRVTINKQEFFIPVLMLLKAFRECSDAEVYTRALGGDNADSFVSDRLQHILREHAAFDEPLHSREQCLAFLGKLFRPALRPPARLLDAEVGSMLLRRHVFVHLAADDHSAKWELLLLMLQKLFALGAGRIEQDNPDSLVHQEVLLPGQLWGMIFKERLQMFLEGLRGQIERELRPRDKTAAMPSFHDAKWFRSTVDKIGAGVGDVGKRLEYFLATGNLVSESGLDLQQTSGFTIVAERLNYWRYLSHFRSIHRGAFFAQLRTTTVRKLLPDSWGFLCPVHTPDGSPCGLLNHLTRSCAVMQASAGRDELVAHLSPILAQSGAVLLPLAASLPSEGYLSILLDAMVLGKVHVDNAQALAAALRAHKVETGAATRSDSEAAKRLSMLEQTISTIEIALVLPQHGGPFPGLYLAAGQARFLRTVRNMELDQLETIGPFEQTTLRIAYAPNDYRPAETSHCETDPTQIFSLVASLTPFCDFNQSPRNMYQCQMGKQTMGTPYHSIPHRVDTKTYRLHTPQSPIVRNKSYDEHAMDEYATGTNAVVAVISYTGYDMEDAMIINKMAYERGFGFGSLYLTVTVDLNEMRRKGEPLTYRFGNLRDSGGPPTPPPGAEAQDEDGLRRRDVQRGKDDEEDESRLYEKQLGADGFPAIGQTIKTGEPLCAYVDESTGRHGVKRHKSGEDAVVEEVRVLGADSSGAPCERVKIKLRVNRNPIPGDKFSSRHGQKGVMARLWPAQDMPFTESGLQPDILFNPHGFPSRMTIGMLLESMAGKAGAAHGIPQDGTPFRFSEKHRAVDYFGEQLSKAGFAYHGTEPMYSGIYGTEMQVRIFVGVVYYQRLRHMVSDKDQVRAKGPVQPLTRQPIHGRKVHGGIRLGEMERDALLAHGTSFIVQERLLHGSDESKALVCCKCGSLLAAMMKPPDGGGGRGSAQCLACGEGKGDVDVVTIPYVFQYLTNELAAMNIRTELKVKNSG